MDRIAERGRKCWCCDEPYSTGCCIGPTCECSWEWCPTCHRCLRCCQCAAPSIEQQIAELQEAGWSPKTSTIWRSPDGKLFLGPHGAWKRMKGLWHE